MGTSKFRDSSSGGKGQAMPLPNNKFYWMFIPFGVITTDWIDL